jgi:5'-deoxynucleotidase
LNHFFALLSRMKYINRWGLMRNTKPENIEEHSLDVAILSHALAELKNRRFGGNINTERIMMLAIYHDVSEIYTGDLPTPVKYFNPQIREAYKQVENYSLEKLIASLPEDLKADYADVLIPKEQDKELWRIIKAADKLSALIKCIEEEKAGNTEFKKAATAQLQSLKQMELPEVDCFMEEFLPSYKLTLDEQE